MRMNPNNFTLARPRMNLTVGGMLRVIRELQELTQAQLSKKTGLSQPVISALEGDRIRLGVERARKLAKALKVHPSVLLFSGWE